MNKTATAVTGIGAMKTVILSPTVLETTGTMIMPGRVFRNEFYLPTIESHLIF